MKNTRKKRTLGLTAICWICIMMAGCQKRPGFYLDQHSDTLTEGPDSMKDTKEEGAEKPKEETFPETEGEASRSEKEEVKSSPEQESMEPARIYVQVSGAVKQPGVYELTEGSRIFEAVELAGGLTDQADEKRLNQAQPATDGQMIYVYAVGEPEDEAGKAASLEEETQQDGRVNLNTASVQQLMALPGIGQAKADGIVSYRETHGAFEKIEDIMEIEGIKEGVFAKIKDQIKVD